MLVLTRKTGQSISLSGGIKFVIKRIGGGQVRVGIEAPEHVKIIRDEINVEENHTVHRVFNEPHSSNDVRESRTHVADGG
jgi:carbon storage regulator